MADEGRATTIWSCPFCVRKWQSEWSLTCHIVGMAIKYSDPHEEWVLEKLPTAYLGPAASVFSVAHQLRPFVGGRVQPLALQVGTNVMEKLGLAYNLMARVEIALHECVVSRLKGAYGDDEREWWWGRHVPENIRQDCGAQRGGDPKRLDDWRYLDLVDLGAIVATNWTLFSADLAASAGDEKAGKNSWKDRVAHLNRLRNEVMHPLKGQTWDEGEFQLVRGWMQRLDALDTSSRPNN